MATTSIPSGIEITPIAPVRGNDAQIVEAPGSPVGNGNGGSQSTLPVSSDSEFKNLSADKLKAAIKSASKRHEREPKKEMSPLLYWLREKLRAQGSRNDLRDRDKGFGAWVEQNTAFSRRTADRWADEYGIVSGLMKRKTTSRHVSKGSEAHPDDALYEEELRKSGKNIQFNYWVSQAAHKRYQQSLKTIKTHFKIANDKEAILKGVSYAAETIAARSRAGNRKNRG